MSNSIYSNSRVSETITEIITSSSFRNIIMDPSSVLEGAYINYQISNIVIKTGSLGPETDVDLPELNNFYFNLSTKEEFKYNNNEEWVLLEEPMIDTIINSGFSLGWVPVETLVRDNYIEILVPRNYLPENFESSNFLFIGFKDYLRNVTVGAFAVPMINSNGYKIMELDFNTTITLPIVFTCGFLPIINTPNILSLEGLNTNTYNPAFPNIHSFKVFQDSHSSNSSSVGASKFLGTTLNF